MVEIFSIAKSLPLTKLFYLGKISIAKSLHIMNLSAVGDKMTWTIISWKGELTGLCCGNQMIVFIGCNDSAGEILRLHKGRLLSASYTSMVR